MSKPLGIKIFKRLFSLNSIEKCLPNVGEPCEYQL